MKKLLSSGYFLISIAAIGISFKSILVKTAYTYSVDPITLAVMRVVISLPFFIIALFIIEGKAAFTFQKKEIINFSLMGTFGLALPIIFSFYSLKYIDASVSSLLVYTYPAITVLMMTFFEKEKLTSSKIISIILTFCGLLFVIKIHESNLTGIDKRGIWFAFLAAFFYAVYNVLAEKNVKKVSPIKVITYCMIFVSILFVIFFGYRTYPSNWQVWLIAFLLGFICGFIPFVAYLYGVKIIGASKSTIVSSLGPAFTVTWAYIFLNERLDIFQILGMVLIITGILAIKLKKLPLPEFVTKKYLKQND
ncbi:MAG: DMT family transporter [Spirochaetia bacterium]|nr:DMT family transporter [Spirochaetia bacterium]